MFLAYTDLLANGVIYALYWVIAAQFFVAASGMKSSKASRMLLVLVGVFVLCAHSGYLPELIAFPPPLHSALHVFLAVMSLIFAASNQAAVIMLALGRAAEG